MTPFSSCHSVKLPNVKVMSQDGKGELNQQRVEAIEMEIAIFYNRLADKDGH